MIRKKSVKMHCNLKYTVKIYCLIHYNIFFLNIGTFEIWNLINWYRSIGGI